MRLLAVVVGNGQDDGRFSSVVYWLQESPGELDVVLTGVRNSSGGTSGGGAAGRRPQRGEARHRRKTCLKRGGRASRAARRDAGRRTVRLARGGRLAWSRIYL
jgi:hypothetical protein